jgi:hypothetical protein
MAGQQDALGLALGLHGHDHRGLDLREMQMIVGVKPEEHHAVRPRGMQHRRNWRIAGPWHWSRQNGISVASGLFSSSSSHSASARRPPALSSQPPV